MNDEKLRQKLRESLQSMQGGDVPAFDAMWANAEKQHGTTRLHYRRIAGLTTAAAVAATAFMLWPLNANHAVDTYLTVEDLLSTTQWVAPSDVLLPEYQFDIYDDLPVLIEAIEFDEGSFL